MVKRFLLIAFLSLLALPAAAQITISNLPSATTPLSGTEVLPIVQGGVTKKVAVSQIGGGSSGFPITIGSTVVSASSTTTTISGLTLNSPTLVTPALGTIASGNLAAGTGYTVSNLAGLGTGVGTALGASASGSGSICLSFGSACGGGSGTVTSVATGACLTGGTITSSGTLSGTYLGRQVTTTSDTILSSDACKLVAYSNASPIAVSLPQATGSFGNGFSFDTQNEGAGTVTITPTTSTINGTSSLTVAQNRGCTMRSDGTNWHVSACTALLP